MMEKSRLILDKVRMFSFFAEARPLVIESTIAEPVLIWTDQT